MATGQEKVNIYLKKFLPQQQMVLNFLEYLRQQDTENLKLQYPGQGFFFGNSIAGIGPNELRAATPSLATDGQGNLLKLDPTNADFTFENMLAATYSVGLRYNVLERGTEVNVRTGQIEYTFFKDAIGEKGEPTAVIDNGSTLTVNVDSIFEASVDHKDRKCIVYLKRAAGQADAFYEGLVEWDGMNNVVNTTHLIGQTAGLVSTDPADYWVFAPGPTVRKNTDLSIDPLYAFLGVITGNGDGNTPTPADIDTSGATVLYGGGSFSTLVDMGRSFLVGGGSISWDLANDTLAWSADLRIKVASKPFDYQMTPDSITLLDGECFYIDADGAVGGIKAPTISQLADVPDDVTAQPIAVRIGNDIYFRDGALELEGDDQENTITTGRLDGTTEDTLSYLGAKNESDSTPDYLAALSGSIANIILLQSENLTAGIKRLEQRDDTVTKVRVVDWLTSVLPAGAAVTIDGQALANNDRVLFAEPTLNGVYEVQGIGVAATWTKLPVFGNGSLVPVSMSLVGVKDSADEFIRTVYQWTAANSWKPLDSSEIQGEPTGFINRTDSEFSFDNGTRTFSIQPKAPAAYYYFGQKGRIFRKQAIDSVVIPNAEGLHFVYFDGAILTSTQVFNIDIILAKTFVSTLYWNVADQEQILLADERHGLAMDGSTHAYLHNTNGCQYASGLGITGTTAGSGAADSDAQVAIDGGRLYDEDLIIDIEDGDNTEFQFAGPATTNVGGDPGGSRTGIGFNTPPTAFNMTATKLFLRMLNSGQTGNVTLLVYEKVGAVLGTLLATSDALDISTLPIEPATHAEITFSFSSPIPLSTSLQYGYILDTSGMSGSTLRMAAATGNPNSDITSLASFDGGANWSENTGVDPLITMLGEAQPFTQVLTPIAQVPVFRKDGAAGDWKKIPAAQFPFLDNSGPQFNDPAGPWTLAPVTDTFFFASYIIATNGIQDPVIAVMGQREDDTLANAQQNNTIDTLDLSGLPTLEFKALYRIIYEYSTGFSNTIKVRQVDITDLRFTESASAAGVSPSDHNALGGRSASGAHPSQSISTSPTDFGGAAAALDLNQKQFNKALDDHFKALRIIEHPSNKQRVIVTGATVVLASGIVLEQQLKNLIVSHPEIQIDFQTGEIFESDGVTPFNGGLNDFTPVIPPVGENRWAGLTFLPSTVNADNTINLQPLILISESDNFRGVFASGIKVGQIKLEEDTGGIADILISNGAIARQGVGGGGGDGSGNANSFLEDLKNRARCAFWKFFTPFIFETDGQAEEDSVNTTASFDIANGEYDFDSGEILATLNQFGSRFLGTSSTLQPEADKDNAKVEVWALYSEGQEDPAPIVRASRDGRGEFQTVPMVRHGNSSLFTGQLTFAEEAADQNLHELPEADADTQVALTDSGTDVKRALQFVVTDKEAQKQLTLYLNKLGSPLGKMGVNIVRDDTGEPLGERIGGSRSDLEIDISALVAGNVSAGLDIGQIVTRPGTYWVEIFTDDEYKTSYSAGVDEIRVRVDNAGSDPDSSSYDDGTETWTPTAGQAIVYLLEGRPLDLRIEIEASQNDVSLKAMGTFYSQAATPVTQGIKLRHAERFDSADNLNEFTIPAGKFLPDPDSLVVYDISEGKTYVYPAFGLDGHKVTFPAGTFNGPAGTDVLLIFDQSKGSGYDNSDQNAALMAANGLGSTDLTIDKSFAGVGVKGRATDGILYNVVPLPGGVGIEITEA